MEAEKTSVCPHYKPFTLWWNEKEGGGNLPCPPDYKFPCCFNEFEKAAQGFFDAEMGSNEEQEHAERILELMSIDDCAEIFVDDLMMDFQDEIAETEHEQYMEEIKIGILEASAALISSMEESQVMQTA